MVKPLYLTHTTRTLALGGLLLALAACTDSPPSDSGAAAATGQNATAVARGKVDIEDGLLDIMPETDGVIRSIEVKTGDTVAKGQILAQLDDRAARIEAATTRSQQQQAEAQLKSLQARLAPARELARRWQQAAAAGAAEQQKADEAKTAWQQLSGDTDAARAALAAAKQKVTQAEWQVSRLTLRAPQNSEVIQIQGQAGGVARAAGKPLFTLLPARPLIIRAEVNEYFIGRIKPGTTASATAESTGTVFKAQVTRVGKVFETARLGDDAQARGSQVVECILTLEADAARQLRVGQNMLVRFQ